jgi:hypothetical protein
MYKIISISHLENPESDVNRELRDGWELIAVTADCGRRFYHFIQYKVKIK